MPAQVVIVGGGFAGVSAARHLRKRNREVEVTIVSRQNYLLFTPMLPEAATGSIEMRDITQPLRAQLPGIRFELGEATGADTHARTLSVRHPMTGQTRTLPFDELVLALGSTSSTMGVSGVEEHAVPLKTARDAEQLRNRVIGALEVAAATNDVVERDRLLRFVVVGGNFTGVEIAGELAAFLSGALPYYTAIDPTGVEIVLLQEGEHLLSHLPEKFGKYAATSLHGRGIRIELGAKAAKVDRDGIDVSGGKRYESRTVIWAAGEEPSPLVKQLGLETSDHGAVKVSDDLAVVGCEHVWALGDCAAVPKEGGGTYPPLAQNALREGTTLAKNITRRLHKKKTKPFHYKMLGQMASLGDRQALAELPGGAMLTGRLAWLVWRTYYLGRLPGLNRKARVAVDWALEFAFPPDFSRLPMVEKGETDAFKR
ncbi:MAG: NAD(P)/FAD-dependent oxidoreductase [Candidatus Eremiobacteraeota bacterium]|nr:NAD(P)/FAD-dependent oxidoreductase [Candidatus Eremiobacteraeota bacterium]